MQRSDKNAFEQLLLDLAAAFRFDTDPTDWERMQRVYFDALADLALQDVKRAVLALIRNRTPSLGRRDTIPTAAEIRQAAFETRQGRWSGTHPDDEPADEEFRKAILAGIGQDLRTLAARKAMP